MKKKMKRKTKEKRKKKKRIQKRKMKNLTKLRNQIHLEQRRKRIKKKGVPSLDLKKPGG